MNAKSIVSLLSLKETLFNYKDTTNDTLLCQGFVLQEIGYELHLSNLAAVIPQENGCRLSLRTINRSLQQSSGLYLLGPLKYWCGGDRYLISIKYNDKHHSEEITLTDGFDQFIHCPFSIDSAFSINFKVLSFGGNNLSSWHHYLSSDYDAVALSLQSEILDNHKVVISSGIHPLLRDIDFLYASSRDPKVNLYSFLKNHLKSLLLKEQLLWIINENKTLVFKDCYRLNFQLNNSIPSRLLKIKIYQRVLKSLFQSILQGLPFKS